MTKNMWRLFSIALLLTIASGAAYAAELMLNGAGASFPFPVYAKWGEKYNQLTGLKLNYQSVGSGAGIKQIKAKTVDFGASDAPLTVKELDESGLVQFPLVMGGIVPVVNIPGFAAGQLRLTPDTLANIFLGKVTYWDDPAIKQENPGADLPHLAIVVVHRSDSSGTTFLFTSYLAAVSPTWKEKVGADKAVNWLTGIAAKGNEGVANNVQRVKGALGYVEYAYAKENKLAHAQLQNKAGQYVQPTLESFGAAAQNADWKNAQAFIVDLNNQQGDTTWPIVGASYIMIYKNQSNAKLATEMLKFFDWSFKHGDVTATELSYVPIPDNVVVMIQDMWVSELKSGGKALWQKNWFEGYSRLT